MRIATEIAKISVGVLVGAGLVSLLGSNVLFAGFTHPPTGIQMSYAELAAINLTAATVALGAVAVVVTIAAVFGFQVIRSASIKASEERVKEELPEKLKNELHRMENDGRLAAALERAIYSGGTDKDTDGDTDVEDQIA
ncbi:hypothetical protein KUG85_02815 [Nitratireductor sp. L1-7-SE]|uniref:LapA family protein n=1 Tax=Nitratireductor rhodophyticola TaxID=2854036 RepID=A0ABS7R313_9HYPH|nr:hypothetical protein [Nitratireductor rhodophyticola]MBY8915314.1 hypothetical protein [Nitratireductor rhodophyticola]MBY8919617.1 hypothetical protein [Nitratireductor rhodophyticola]